MASKFQEEVYDGEYDINGGGYDVQVIESYPQDFNCGICHLIIKDATHGCVNHVFCKSCLHQHIQHGVRDEGKIMCPGGCKEVVQSDLQLNNFANRMIIKLKTKCKNDRCQWKGDLLDLVQDHQSNCEYSLVSCNNEGCEIMFLKKDFLQHANDCLLQIVECMYCQNHVVKMNKESHDIECSNEKVDCIFYHVGCNEKVFRKNLILHESKNHVKHTRMIYESFKNQQKESTEQIILLKQENKEIKVKFIEELSLLKHTRMIYENLKTNELKVKFVELEKKSKEQIESLNEALQLKTTEINQLKVETKKHKEDNEKLKDGTKKLSIKLTEEILKLKDEILQFDLKIKANDIKRLKVRLNKTPVLKERVSLLNNDSVVYAPLKFMIPMDQLSNCYNKYDFDYLIKQLDLLNHKVLLDDLFHEIPCHVYEYKKPTDRYRNDYAINGYICLPMDFNDIQELYVPSSHSGFKILYNKNEFYVEQLNNTSNLQMHLFTGEYQKKIFNGEKIDFRTIEFLNKMNFSFGENYACLHYSYNVFTL